ncbi:hypothetical protein SDC9_160028 [bioreactor metagenome]|uniref:Uncharacterized protein n=1 Tax=bioreactor metagenome TaxID=1076179 RepID=A0A645FH90_9ZZZZ
MRRLVYSERFVCDGLETVIPFPTTRSRILHSWLSAGDRIAYAFSREQLAKRPVNDSRIRREAYDCRISPIRGGQGGGNAGKKKPSRVLANRRRF